MLLVKNIADVMGMLYGMLTSFRDVLGKKTLEIFCGGGKTLIAGHVLRHVASQTPNKFILCLAPLRVSVDQLMRRIESFVSSTHDVLLVDSDEGGTTDKRKIASKIQKALSAEGRPIAVFTTFKSAQDIFASMLPKTNGKMYIVVDEVHNVVGNEVLCGFINRFKNGLLLSATIPEELFDVLDDVDVGFEYGISEAITNKYCCDYNIYLPLLNETRDKVVVDIPVDFENYDKDMMAKAMFLSTGMLQKGSRRCIVYLANQAECDIFLNVARKVFEEYHGIPFWGDKIDSTVPRNHRNEIFKEFESASDPHKIRIIASVRILDEAIDIPKCDSEFITVVGDSTSDIRTVQRLCRGSRLDVSNPSKKNNLFMWCEDWSNAVGCLTLLKESDVEFHKKIGIVGADYDKFDVVGEKTRMEKQIGDIRSYVAMRCLSLDERWEMRRQEWIGAYVKKGCKKPSQKSKDPDEKKAGDWQSCMRQAKKWNGNGNGCRLTDEQIEILNNTNGWTWEGC